MPRRARVAPGGVVYHVLNRGVGRMELFADAADYAAFERCLGVAQAVVPMRLLAYSLMPNHWHLVLWPGDDGDLGRFMQRLTLTHARRWQEHRHQHGTGHVYQGRYKSFPVQRDEHLLAVLRYVERNPLRAGLAARAEDWRWTSLWRRRHPAQPPADPAEPRGPELTPWPIAEPASWLRRVNAAQSPAELAALRRSVTRGQPYGARAWVVRQTVALGLESAFRPRGRPGKNKDGSA